VIPKNAFLNSRCQNTKTFDLTTSEVTSRLKKDWVADEKAYDEGHTHMLMFADVLTDGIAKQYPAKFSK